jgi:hypothetical protein
MPRLVNKLSIQSVIAVVKSFGMTCAWKPDTREYRVNFKGGSEDSAYYTQDGQDAIDTARILARSAELKVWLDADLDSGPIDLT